MELWNDYGITSYNFGNHDAQLPTTYWVMKNVFDYQKPKCVVIDGHYLEFNRKTSATNFMNVHIALDTFPISKTKINAVMDLLDDPELVEIKEKEVDLKSILGIMSLAVLEGASIEIEAKGSDAEEAIAALKEMIK